LLSLVLLASALCILGLATMLPFGNFLSTSFLECIGLGFSPSIALIQRNAIRLCSSNELWVLERESGDGGLTEASADGYCSALAWLGVQGVCQLDVWKSVE